MIIRTIRKLTALVLTLALTFTLVPAWAQAAETEQAGTGTSISAFSKYKTLRILAVGNSFSVDGLHYLYQMADSAGYDVIIGNLYKSSCDLKSHWNSLAAEDATYTYYEISDKTDGAWGRKDEISINWALQKEQWDVITLQQASGESGIPESYYQAVSWSCDTGTTGGTVGRLSAEPETAEISELAAAESAASGDTSEEEGTSSVVTPEPEEDASTAESSESEEADQSPATQAVGDQDSARGQTAQSISCGVAASGSTLSFALDATAQTDLSYQSSNTSVAQVDESGTVTLTGSGTATVTITAASSDQYASATAKVTVTSSLTSYLELLTDQIRTYYKSGDKKWKGWGASAARKLKFGWQMTWAYAKEGVNSDFANSYALRYHSDQDTMYQAITDTAQSVVKGSNLFSFCVPAGTAIQNARSSYAGDRLNRDGVHLSYGIGRYLAAMTWAATLGLDVGKISYLPTGSKAVSSLDLDMIRASVTAAKRNPWQVTSSAYGTAPTLAATTLKTPVNLSSGIKLTWTKVGSATGYRIYRRVGSGSWSKIKTITTNATTTYTDTAVKSKSGTTYTYSVRAYSGELITADAARMQQTRLVAPAKTTVSNTDSGIKVTWSTVTGATGYRVYRKKGDGTRTCVKTIDSGKTAAYTDTAVKSKNGTAYTYDVVACSALGESVPSSAKTVVRLTGVTAKSLKKSGSALKLTWTQNSKATGYYIYRKVGSGSWSKVKTISKNSTLTYTDKTVKKGKTYSYRICAYKGDSTSVVSGTKTLKR